MQYTCSPAYVENISYNECEKRIREIKKLEIINDAYVQSCKLISRSLMHWSVLLQFHMRVLFKQIEKYIDLKGIKNKLQHYIQKHFTSIFLSLIQILWKK